jgi:DNA-binding transcriptional ArsR family regulator
MPDLESRVARLEELVARLLPSEGADPAAGSAPDLHAWIDAQTKANAVFVFAGAVHPGARATTSRGWSAPTEVALNLRRTAAVCAALSSEPRLAMLQELMHGPRTTAELMEALRFDRGQLYHHLRDLFVQAMVEQPERGRYALTGRGIWALLLAGLLAGDAPVAAEFPPDEGSI